MKTKLMLGVLLLSLALVSCIRPAPALPPEVDVQVDCTQSAADSVAQGIAKTYNVPYEQVMAWACRGETYDDILLALETAKLTDRSMDELFELRKKEGSWDKVWETLGLVSQ